MVIDIASRRMLTAAERHEALQRAQQLEHTAGLIELGEHDGTIAPLLRNTAAYLRSIAK